MFQLVKNKWSAIDASRRDFISHGLVAISFRILGVAASFFMNLAVARGLGAEEAGLFFLAWSLVVVLSSVGRMGLDNTLLRFISAAGVENQQGKAKYVVRTALSWAFVASALLAVFLYVFSGYLASQLFSKPNLEPVFKNISLGLPFLSLLTLSAQSLQAIRKIPNSIFTLNIGLPLTIIATVLLLKVQTAEQLSIAYIAGALFTFALGYLWWGRSVAGVASMPIEKKQLVESCLPLLVVVMMNQLVQWSGQVIGGIYLSAEEIGRLAIAARLAALVAFVLVAVNLVVAPRIAVLYRQEKREELQKLMYFSVRLMLMVAVPVVLLLCIWPEAVMGFFGEDFVQGALPLQILAVGQLVNVASGSVAYLLTMSGHERDFRNMVLISGPLSVLLAFVLIPFLGVTGAALSTALSLAIQNLLAVVLVKRRLGFNTLAFWR